MVKRIFMISDFQEATARSIRIQPRMWIKGLIRLGHDVHRFSYGYTPKRFSPFAGKFFRRFIPKYVKRYADEKLLAQIRAYHPDVIFFHSMEFFDSETVERVRESVRDAVIVGRDEEAFPDRHHSRLSMAKKMDIVLATSGGKFLETYKNAGVKLCAFIPNLCDPDIQYRYTVGQRWKADIIFTGRPIHTRLNQIGDRYHLIEKISKKKLCKVYGAFGNPQVEGLDYFYAISGARIGLSINIVNDIELYHSDRLINYISCGTFTLAKRVPKSELLFKDGEHIRYFDIDEEFLELADWYLGNDEEREKIARAGMEHAHKEFNCTRIAGFMMELIEKGSFSAPWAIVL